MVLREAMTLREALKRGLRARIPRQRPGILTAVISLAAHALSSRPVAPIARVQEFKQADAQADVQQKSLRAQRTSTVKSPVLIQPSSAGLDPRAADGDQDGT
jgi:hypothetical protein